MRSTAHIVTTTLLLSLGVAADVRAQEPLGSPGSIAEATIGNRLAYAAMSLVYPDYRFLPVPLYGYNISALNRNELEGILEDARTEDVRATVVVPGGENEPGYFARAIRVDEDNSIIIDSLREVCRNGETSNAHEENGQPENESNICPSGMIAFSKPLRDYSETQRFMASARLWSFDTSAE